ncbi:hypothetical protein ACSQ67_026134 [Phaseolus vulgaris]
MGEEDESSMSKNDGGGAGGDRKGVGNLAKSQSQRRKQMVAMRLAGMVFHLRGVWVSASSRTLSTNVPNLLIEIPSNQNYSGCYVSNRQEERVFTISTLPTIEFFKIVFHMNFIHNLNTVILVEMTGIKRPSSFSLENPYLSSSNFKSLSLKTYFILNLLMMEKGVM